MEVEAVDENEEAEEADGDEDHLHNVAPDASMFAAMQAGAGGGWQRAQYHRHHREHHPVAERDVEEVPIAELRQQDLQRRNTRACAWCIMRARQKVSAHRL